LKPKLTQAKASVAKAINQGFLTNGIGFSIEVWIFQAARRTEKLKLFSTGSDFLLHWNMNYLLQTRESRPGPRLKRSITPAFALVLHFPSPRIEMTSSHYGKWFLAL